MNSNYLSLLGRRIVSIRKQKGVSQHGLAALTGTTVNRIESIENGETDVLAQELKRISEALNVEVKEFELTGLK